LLKLDPYSEPTYRSLMTAYLAQGARGGAIRQYERCRKILQTHLAVEPSRETETLFRHIVDGSVARVQLPSRSQPGVAVLPFANLTSDAAQDDYCRVIVEDIVGELSRFRSLRVIACNSSLAVGRAGRSLRDIGGELGVDYVLEGSVRRAEEGARVTAQLSEVASGVCVWSDRYDAPANRVFEFLDRITRAVAGALAIRIDEELLQRAKRRGDSSLGAYECWLRGRECFNRGTPESSAQAVDFFRRALEADPAYARAHAGLAIVYFSDWNCHGWDRWEQCETRAFDHARKAVELDDSDHVSHCILSRIHLFRRAFERAANHMERAIALNSNDADCLARMAATRAQLGEAAAGIALGEAALSLNPRYPDWYVAFIGLAYLMAARHEDAVALMERAPDAFIDTRAFLALSYTYLGDGAKARENAEAFRAGYERKIAFGRQADTVEAMRWVLHVTPFRHETDAKYLRKGLKKAGIGE
jgi:TolB-like protein/Flp pilus assembly protein TadD